MEASFYLIHDTNQTRNISYFGLFPSSIYRYINPDITTKVSMRQSIAECIQEMPTYGFDGDGNGDALPGSAFTIPGNVWQESGTALSPADF